MGWTLTALLSTIICVVTMPASVAKPISIPTMRGVKHQESYEKLRLPGNQNTVVMSQRGVAGIKPEFESKAEFPSGQTMRQENQATVGKLRKISEKLKHYVVGGLDCDFCKLVMRKVQLISSTLEFTEEIVRFATALCVDLDIEDVPVCSGLVSEFQVEVLTVLRTLVLRPEEVCGVVFGQQCGTPYFPWDSWNISLPAVPKPPVPPYRPPKPGGPRVRMLHLTDIHLDLQYKAGTKAPCGEPLCCRHSNGAPDPGQTGAGPWGDYRHCDTPLWTLESLLDHLRSKQDQFDYIIWTGDAPAHDIWNQSRAGQLHTLDMVSSLLQHYLPSKPVFASLGNHEAAPVNSFPPPFVSGNSSISWLYSALASDWSRWLPKTTDATIRRGAYYTVSPFPGLRLVSLNMNYCNNQNWWLLLNTTDPAEELQWLVSVLQAAEDRGEKVHILGHIPPGSSDCLKGWSWNYYKIINRYESTVAGQFFGHTHYDHYEIFYDDVSFKLPLSVAYITPSVTPYVNLNMGYRIYTLDGNHPNSSWAVLDHETYIMNLTEANLVNTTKWVLEYSAKAAFNMSVLTPAAWNDLIHAMKTDDRLLQQFYRFYLKSHVAAVCDSECKASLLCGLKSGRSHDEEHLCQDVTGHQPLPPLFAPNVC